MGHNETSAGPLAPRLDTILAERARALPVVDRENARWVAVAQRLGDLETAVERLRGHPDASPELRAALELPGLRELQRRIAEVQERHRRLAVRFTRPTITVGVSGQARVGKSRMLQTASGLTGEQIPVGSGRPVTATRIRLQHSPGESRAVALLHSERSFLDAHVTPYHVQLGLLPAPDDLAAFAATRYPAEAEWPVDSQRVLLKRLRDNQAALAACRPLLTGGETQIPMDALRGYVAYPTADEERSGRAARHYLAVREVRINCGFTRADVGRISLVDLPGLGEAVPDADRHHVAGLRDEVDVVLMIKRPVEGMAYWGKEDKDTLALLEEARGGIRRTGDFVLLVVNRAEQDAQELVEELEKDLLDEGVAGPEGRHFRILRGNAADPASVDADILEPLLRHLAERLPRMDGDLIGGAADDAQRVADAVRQETAAVRSVLAGLRGHASVPEEVLDTRADELRKDLTADLAKLIAELHEEADLAFEDEDYTAAVERAYTDLRGWIELGLGAAEGAGPAARAWRELRSAQDTDGTGDPADASRAGWTLDGEEENPLARQARALWTAAALRELRVADGAAPFANAELNRVRVEISRRFGAIDAYFERRVRRLHERVAEVIRDSTGALLDPALDGTETLRTLHRMLREGYEPCPELSDAVADLLAVRLDYRTQLHPMVRSQLNELHLEVRDPATNRMTSQVSVEITEAGAEELYEFVGMRAEQAAFQTSQALLSRSVVPALVMFTAAEQFEDAFIRAGGSEREFKRLARTYRNELWPGWSDGLAGEHARYASVSRACDAVEEALGDQPRQPAEHTGERP